MEELFIGKKASLNRVFTEEDVRACNAMTRDFNQVYNSTENIWKEHYQQPLVPGILTEGLIAQVITDRLPGCACILLQKEVIFYHPVHIGDSITAELEIVDINVERKWITQKLTCFNQEGADVIKGQMVILLLNQ